MNMKNLRGKLAVITGGSSGIGFSIAKMLVQRGARIVIVARDSKKLMEAKKKLETQSQYPVNTVSLDISRLEELQILTQTVNQLAPCADIIINSAGIASAGLLNDTPQSEWERLYNLNVRGLVGVLQALTPAMEAQSKKDNQARHIVNMASAAGILGSPGASAYGATKGAVISLSKSLRAELSVYNIGVSVICPAYVKTPISERLQAFGRMDNPKTYRSIENLLSKIELTPEDVARSILKSMEKNTGLVQLGREPKMSDWLTRFLPKLIESIFSKQLGKQVRA